MAAPLYTAERSRLVDEASTAKIKRTLALHAVEALGWADPRATLALWHKYVVARNVESAAEDALFGYDLEQALGARQ